jgi:preprotein translocase subunit SecE
MSTALYKPGQGYWTRMMSAIGLATLVVMGAFWASEQVIGVRLAGLEPIYTQAAIFLLIVIVFAVVGYYLIGRYPRVVDFMIATESEMKKVNWSTRREIIGSTWVVIGLTVFLGVLCWMFDLGFQWIFTQVKVLES